MTPVSYEEASEILDVAVITLRHAASRGALTRLPRKGQMQPIIKEQCLLFKGKRLSLNALNSSEREIWDKYDKQVNQNSVAETVVPNNDQLLAAMGLLAGAGTLALMPVVIPSVSQGSVEVPQGNPFLTWRNLLKDIR